ncbi:GUN4 domain-containing protein [Hyella patelloides]|uniref:GUN4 domain-containing protein n=1 Tax=Hyella patelloides TaxID=1982969 RepID=UPI003CCC7102
MRPSEIKQTDCSELQVIARWWLIYSDNRFGFSVQVKIYVERNFNIFGNIIEQKC